jgi:DNA replication protein DnaC
MARRTLRKAARIGLRTARQVERYEARLEGLDPDRARFKMLCYLACIPKDFWSAKDADVNHNRDHFEKLVLPYVKSHRKARRYGYGLLLMGDNGSGKSMFLSYILTQMIYRGYTVYYTTMQQLALDISTGFNDHEFARELEEQLRADFVVIDELGKEHDRAEYMQKRLEHLLKSRYDDNDPTLLGTNLSLGDFVEQYHSTIKSMVDGKYSKAVLDTGDFRKAPAAKKRQRMGYTT